MRIDLSHRVFELDEIPDCRTPITEYIQHYLESYIEYLKSNNCSNDIIYTVTRFTRLITTSLLEYYCGQHESSYEYFKEAIGLININQIIDDLPDALFYRARKNETLKDFTRNELFHISFEERYKIKTQRFSYPGLPCLYLGSSVETCCAELECETDVLTIAKIRKYPTSKVRILDLFFFEQYKFDTLTLEEENKFLLFWPLVACCSISYKSSKVMTFRPDYILPQLLLEYIVDKNAQEMLSTTNETLCGIRYHSVKKAIFDRSKMSMVNYVFPAVSSQSSGLCEILKQCFFIADIRSESTKSRW